MELVEAIEIALTRSIATEKARVERAQGTQSLAEGVVGVFPRLTASSSVSDTSLTELTDGMWTSQLNLSMPVVDATAIMGLVSGIQQNGLSRAESRQTMAKLVLDVQNSYYNLAKAQALLASVEGQYARAEENTRIAERRYQLGATARTDKLRSEANLLSAERELISARANVEAGQRNLANLLGFEAWSALQVTDLPDAEKPDSLAATVVSAALLEQNPDFEVLRRQVQASDLAAWGAWAGLLPSLSFTAGKGFTQDGVIPDVSQWDDVPTSYGLSITFPFVNVTNQALMVNRARLARKQSRLNLARQELAFTEHLASLVSAQSSSFKGWEAASKSVELSREVYRLTARGYELGANSLADVLQVEAELIQADRALVESKALYWSSRAELNYFLGVSLEER